MTRFVPAWPGFPEETPMPEPATTYLDLDEGYIRTERVAELLHVSRKTVTRWAREGRLPPAIRTLAGHRRWSERAIRDLAASMTTPATVGPAAGGGSR